MRGGNKDERIRQWPDPYRYLVFGDFLYGKPKNPQKRAADIVSAAGLRTRSPHYPPSKFGRGERADRPLRPRAAPVDCSPGREPTGAARRRTFSASRSYHRKLPCHPSNGLQAPLTPPSSSRLLPLASPSGVAYNPSGGSLVPPWLSHRATERRI
jgi:hypothetical protein